MRLSLLGLVVALTGAAAGEVPVFVPRGASPAERLAAEDLTESLRQLYPGEGFVLANALPSAGRGIVVGCATNAAVRGLLEGTVLAAAESFVVTSRKDGARELGVIAGADARGVAYGVYGLLERLGFGLYLSGDALPGPRGERFSFASWTLTNSPLVRERIVFDWHNFLSGCSAWNLADWNKWIEQSHKGGFNGIMVHAYGNNPMASFKFHGRAKPAGYLSTTIAGRDWSTMHVNDVRRLWGGWVFDGPVFGSEAGLAPAEQRVEAAQALMQSVFAHAREREMDVYFALDVDTPSANPQGLILTLPEGARFAVPPRGVPAELKAGEKFWLADPDTPEGYAYYRAEVEGLLRAYPKITCLVEWFRAGGTPWTELKVEDLPTSWQQEYRVELARTPEAAKYWRVAGMFALGKISRALERALKELGRQDVAPATGSWRFEFLPGADRFFPRQVKFIALDYEVLHGRSQLEDAERRRFIREVAAHRAVIPVGWAQHDDGAYVGRPFTPFTDFHAKLADAGASGFGIIHWTTRPLDLYFASLSRQVWQATRDEPLAATCADVAARLFGTAAREPMGEYLLRWVTSAPSFGRETSDRFIDRPLTNVAAVVAGCRERLKLLEKAPVAGLSPAQRDRLDYFRGLEQFIQDFCQTHDRYQQSQVLARQRELAGARRVMADCRPEGVIEEFARFGSLGGMSRGERGLLVSLNLRWLTHIIGHRQALGLEPVRIRFAPTQHDDLAQSPGRLTFYFETNHTAWACRGTRETGAQTFVTKEPEVTVVRELAGTDAGAPGAAGARRDAGALGEACGEVGRAGIEASAPVTIPLGPMAQGEGKSGSDVPAGDYRLRVLFVEASATAEGQRVFEVSVTGSVAEPVRDRLDVFGLARGRHRIIEKVYTVTVTPPGRIGLTLTPVVGKAVLSGVVLEPLEIRLREGE